MNSSRYIPVLAAGILMAGAMVQAQSPELIVETDRAQLYEGESLVYRLTLNHVEDPPVPDLSAIDGFDVEFLGQQSLDSRQISIINGQRSDIVRRGRQFTWRLTPQQAGTLVIPAPSVEVDGETVSGRALEVRVNPPDDQETVILEQTVDRSSVYPMQPFTVTLVIAVKELPEEVGQRDPLTVQPKLPVLSVPWLDDSRLPEGLAAERNWNQLLEPLISRRGYGVQINNIGAPSAFSLFNSTAAGFHPTPERTIRENAAGEEVGYWEYTFQRTLIPERTGFYQLGAVTLKGTFADRVEGGRLSGSELYVVAGDISVEVKGVPSEGRPESYIGAVGRFELDAELAPLSIRVGDPMTLTLRLTGDGTLEEARPPEIADLPGIAGKFRTYEATEESDGRSRTFIYSLRPLNAEVDQFPSIDVSCFDVESEQYVTLRTPAFPVTVTDAEALADSDIVAPDSLGEGDPAYGLERNVDGVFANITDLNAVRDDRIRPARWFAAWGGMIVLSGALSLGIGRFRRLTGDPAMIRQRQAPAAAATALNDAAAQLQSGDMASACDSIRRAIAGVTASWAGVPEEGLTARDAAEHLRRLEVETSLAEQTARLLEECDAARYGGSGQNVSQLVDQAHGLVHQLMRSLRSRRSAEA